MALDLLFIELPETKGLSSFSTRLIIAVLSPVVDPFTAWSPPSPGEICNTAEDPLLEVVQVLSIYCKS
jgi:hypothetical protein